MAKKTLTDRMLKALKAAPKGKRYDVADSVVPGLAVRVTDKGKRTFIFVARYPGSTNPTRRALGEYGALTLEDARKKARGWIEIIQRGTDPKIAEQRERLAVARAQKNSFAAVAEEFIQREVSKLRRADEVERVIRKELISRWAKHPIIDITRDDVVAVLDELVDRDAPYQAHAVLAYVRRLFNWALSRPYGLESSPCDRIKPKDVIGRKKPRTRTLTDDEIRALSRALDRMAYPFGPLFRTLLLTGQRKSEVGDAIWPEFDTKTRLWSLSPERMKADAAHVVPLVPEVLELLKSLPRFTKGDYAFSTTFGVRPVGGYSKAKKRLDKLVLEELRKLADERGESSERVKLVPWRIHDIRRTVRTHLSALPISDLVRELVIAHSKPGLHKVYDQHAYTDEKRQALELWAARLHGIVAAPIGSVVQMVAAE